jgi:hypothetical protein
VIAKPQPNQLIKEIITRQEADAITLYVSSEDADEFIHNECHSFGHLIPLDFGAGYGYLLYVSPFYDPKEVNAYILSYNEGAKL